LPGTGFFDGGETSAIRQWVTSYHYRHLFLRINAQRSLDQKPTSAILSIPEYLTRSQTELDTIPLHRGLDAIEL